MAGSQNKGITVFEFVAGSIGFLAIFGIILLGAGLGYVFGLPYFLTGPVVGLVVAWAIIAGSFAGSVTVVCAECGHKEKVAGSVGSHLCANCGRVVALKKEEPKVTLYSAFPTDN